MLLAFDDELEKQNAASDLLRSGLGMLKDRAGTSAALGGAGAALGGLAGGGLSGIKNYRAARQAGATRGQAAMYGAQKGLKSGAHGAMVGGALGAGAGLAAGGKGSQLAGLAEKITGKEYLGGPSRFAQRQVHSLTGYGTPEQVKAMRAGSYRASERAGRATKGLEEAWGGSDTGALKKAVTEQQRASKGLAAAEKAEKMGLTSLPGYTKSLAKNPLGTIAAGAGEQWHGSGNLGKAALIGLPVGMAGMAMAAPTKEGGPGRLERGARALGSSLTYSMAPIAGMAGMGLLNRGVSAAGGVVGAGGDVALKRRRKVGGELPESQRGPESDDSGASHPQMYYSQAAMGKPPESVGM